MISQVSIKRYILIGLVALINFTSFSQITSGKIIYERKTNLKKLLKDNERIKAMGMELDTRLEDFDLYFNESNSAFTPSEGGEEIKGWGKYLTSHNSVYKDIVAQEKLVILDMWGNEMIVKDKILKREWKITEKKRKLAGYMCRMAIWEMNDSTRIYAWFSVDVVLSIGPEGFEGLPGAILGLATEDGAVIYFAKEVVAMAPPKEKLTRDIKGKDVHTIAELKEILLEKMGRYMKPEDLDAMFSWL